MLKSININKFCTLKFFRGGCFSTTVKKTQTVVLNNRRHLRISHKQTNTAEFLRIPCFRVVHPGIFCKESPQEIQKLCKEARPHRPSSEYLADSARKSTRGPQKMNFTLQEYLAHSATVCTVYFPFPPPLLFPLLCFFFLFG